MRTPLIVAVGTLLAVGVVVGVTSAQAGPEDVVSVQPIRVEAPADPAAPGAVPWVAPPDPNGYVAPPPADDDDDDLDDGPDGDGDD